jgi:hypothetical protein
MPVENEDENREAVFQEVQSELGFRGTRPADGTFALGDWVWRYHWRHAPEKSEPVSEQSYNADGSAPAKALDGSYDNPKDRWVFNEDRTLSRWSYVDPMPEYGIDEPTYSEDRFHVLVRDADTFALFNADGSVIMVHERAKG